MREDELRPGRRERQIEELLAVAGYDVEVVHQHDHPEIPGTLDHCEHARVGRVEFLGVRMELQDFEAQARDARDLGHRSIAIVGMHRRDRQHARVFAGEREMGVVVASDLRGISRKRLVRTAEPHSAEARLVDPRHLHLRLILLE